MSPASAPPYSITPEILSLVERIGEEIGRVEAAGLGQDLRLRREARVRTVHGSVAIEGNELTEEQVSAILGGQRVIGRPRDVLEVRNALAAYDRAEGWAPSSEADLLTAHETLMAGLMEAPGHYRNRQVGVVGPGAVHHIGPPANRVSGDGRRPAALRVPLEHALARRSAGGRTCGRPDTVPRHRGRQPSVRVRKQLGATAGVCPPGFV